MKNLEFKIISSLESRSKSFNVIAAQTIPKYDECTIAYIPTKAFANQTRITMTEMMK